MKYLILLIIAFFVWLLARNKKNLGKPHKIFKLNKRNLNIWMSFSKKKRFELSKRDSSKYLSQRKNLLKQIRNEYKNISKSKK